MRFFARLDEKHKLLESLRKFSKVFLRKLRKMHSFSIFIKKFNKAFVNFFCAFGQKMQIAGKFWENLESFWWKFYRKFNFFIFIFILENLLLKIEPSGITPFFYNNFFGFEGGFPHLAPPLNGLARFLNKKAEPYISNFSSNFFCFLAKLAK